MHGSGGSTDGNWLEQSEMTLTGPVIEVKIRHSLWLDVGRDDGNGKSVDGNGHGC